MSGLGSLANKQNELKEQVKKFAQNEVKPSLQEAFTDLNRLIPGLTSIKWRQYTPYFNDGDECVFRVREAYMALGGEVGGDYDDGYLSPWDPEFKALSTEQQSAFRTFSSNLQDVAELLKVAFGDHAQIILNATGIEVTEYDHE